MVNDHHQTERVREVVQRWAAAERSGDATALRTLLTDDFAGIGPHGFVLDKQQWLARYLSADLDNEAFTVDETAVRISGTTAIAVGVQTQRAAYRGHPVHGRFRLTAVLVGGDRAWSITHVQLSTIQGQ
jgi:uncharacterized protein (TIGR02246 family)